MSRAILITGASSGIGRALALEMAGKGYRLGLTARRYELLEALRDEIHEHYPGTPVVLRTLDVTDYDRVPMVVREVSDELGGLDIVVANAGVGASGATGDGQFEKNRHTINTNLTGAMATVDAAVELFLPAGAGQIVGISSVVAFRGLPGSAAYCASKAGLAVYLEGVRAELYRTGIDVTVLYPGFIDTPMNNDLPRRPFVVDAARGARIITRLIERKVRSSTVPVVPWAVLSRLLRILPLRAVARLSSGQ
ncbi:MAG: SDR family oxidoreductase [Spirochaetia bacterium]